MKSHLLLMSENVSYENIFNLLKELVYHLVECDHFSFFQLKKEEFEIY